MASKEFRARRTLESRLRSVLDDPETVLSGPFKGMRYPLRSSGQGGLLPKLLGTYERELSPAIERLISDRPTLVVNVGAAEGYYAVGLALRAPQAQVIAFEMERPLHGAIPVCGPSPGGRR